MTSDIREFLAANPDLDAEPSMEDLGDTMARAHAFADEHTIPFISAYVIIKDVEGGERMHHWVERGLDARTALAFVGSFARLDFCVWAVEQGHMDRGFLLDNLPDLWRGSDPDDTDPRFLALWLEARDRNGGRLITDLDEGEDIPAVFVLGEWVTVYRGELGTDDPRGIAWSLDPAIAAKFAKTGGLRGAIDLGGTVHVRKVPVEDVIAYLHHRGEAEVVIDPVRL